MPFEPIETDEKIEGPIRRKDFDAELLFGCTGFVLVAIGGYALTIWPIFFANMQHSRDLMVALAEGAIPTSVFGAVLMRKFGLPGACGFFAAALASGIFLMLRLEQVFLLSQTRVELEADYP